MWAEFCFRPSPAAVTPAFKADFLDIARPSGLTVQNVFGGVNRKDYILETTGNGVAIFDYDGDGRNDIFIVNGTRLEAQRARMRAAKQQKELSGSSGGALDPATVLRDSVSGAGPQNPLPQLYHNEGNGRFKNVAAQAGFTYSGWGQGVCVGDYDNDGHPDLLVTYYGHNILYRNNGDGTFTDVTAKAHLPTTGTRFGSGCSFVDYDRDGYLDLFVSNYVDLDLAHTPHPGSGEFCVWKDIPVMCGPRGLPKAHNILYHNNGDGTFTDVSESAGILAPGGRLVMLGSYPAPIGVDQIPHEASVVFSSVYRNDTEFAAALRLLARGLISTAPLTTAVLPLADHEKAFASLRDPDQAVKIFLDPAL